MKQDDALKQWVERWRSTCKALDRIKREELQRVDTSQAIHNLDTAFRMALRQTPIRFHSGLVEMQAWFRKLKA